MLELPEAYVYAQRINEKVKGRKIVKGIAGYTPHKLTWYYGDPQIYGERMAGQKIGQAKAWGGLLEITIEDRKLVFSDGVGLRYHGAGEKRPVRHQLLLEFDDGTALSGVVQMYGGITYFQEEEYDNIYYWTAREKPSPLAAEFTEEYFRQMLDRELIKNCSAKAFLATEQRIPGLGNGVLQDILWYARIHPKRKIGTLSESEREDLFCKVKDVLKVMADNGGRDTEKNLYGEHGGYATVMSKNSLGCGCPVCHGEIRKESYLGGSIYYCPVCQAL